MVNMGELFANPRILNIPMDLVPISEKEHGFILKPGDLLFARQSLVLSGAGQCSIFLGNLVPTVFESHLIRCRLDLDRCDPRFYFYYFRSQEGRRSMDEIVEQGAGASGIRGSDLARLPVPVPPLSYQREVGATLGVLDDRITLLRETNATLEAIAQALFKSWFVDFDPVRAKAEGRSPDGMDEATAALFPDGFEESELGLVPRGWVIGAISDLAKLNPESWTARNHPRVLAYVDLANTKENVITTVAEFDFDEAPSRARRVLRDGDTIVGTVRPGNRSFAFIREPEANLTGSTGFAVLRPIESRYAEFVYLVATQDSSIEYLTHLADGAAYPAVRPDVVGAIQTCIPPDGVLESFHEVAAPLFAKVAHNQRQAQTLATLHDTLLPRLISGQLRSPEAEVESLEAIA
ncbi:MAG TPA: restriction endonuclease subunit S [Azoarcus taiwanensis]|nr:restriction endonuclease subunit S [Azoarcus taiwanensis]